MPATGRNTTIIVGAGLAGAAAGYALSQREGHEVIVLEREDALGSGSSSKSAGMVRQIVESPAIARLAQKSARAYAELASQKKIRFDARGSFLMGSADHLERLLLAAPASSAAHLVTRSFVKDRMNDQVPPGVSKGIFSPGDGIIDVSSVLDFFRTEAEKRGARFLTGCEALEITVRAGRIAGLKTTQGQMEASRIVDAAGAWAADWLPASHRPVLRHFRRHLFVAADSGRVSRDAPFLWDVDRGFYYRPDDDGLLLCICDGDEVKPTRKLAAGDELPLLPAVAERLVERCRDWLPQLPEVKFARSWAGLRSFSPDGDFILGPVPELPGLFLACGLGGHGVTCAHEVGRLVAAAVAGENPAELGPFLPGRLREMGIET